jgi:heme oxygenase
MSTLRELTATNHQIAENLPFMRLFMAKAITAEEYMNYTTQMQVIYSALEYQADKHGILSELQGIARLNNIRRDLSELNQIVGKQSIVLWHTVAYHNHIVELKTKQEVLGHFYVRYAGDMFGGQMLKPLVPAGKATWYDFENNLPTLRQKMREIATPDLAEYANEAFDYTIRIVDDLIDSPTRF